MNERFDRLDWVKLPAILVLAGTAPVAVKLKLSKKIVKRITKTISKKVKVTSAPSSMALATALS